MVAIKNVAIFAATAAALVLPRDPATVLKDLQTIDTDTKSLTSLVTSWDGTLGGAIGIQNAESKVESDVNTASSDATASGSASEAQASSIISFINNSLEPDVKASINALIAKKSSFSKNGLTSTVKNDLNSLKSKTDSLGNTLVGKAPSDQQSAAKAALAKLDADFQSGISAFS